MSKPTLSRGAELLESWRGKATQAQACELLDLDEPTFSRFVNGVRKPTAEVGVRLERLTNGYVTAASWYDPPRGSVERKVRRKARAA